MSTVTINGIIYTLNASNFTASVTGFVTNSILANSTIESSVTNSGTTYTVTSIFNTAFQGCSSLTSVTIPNSVTSIGRNAFYNCTNLTSVTFQNNSVVTSIGSDAFYFCSNLKSITIPNSVTSIGNTVFQGCSNLTSITIPNSVTSIGFYAFYFCTKLKSVYLPVNVNFKILSQGIFENCFLLETITIPNSITAINTVAFKTCTSLINVTIVNPSLITTVSTDSFTNVKSNVNSVITFYNTASYNNLSSTWQYIANNYYNTQNYNSGLPPTLSNFSDISFNIFTNPIKTITLTQPTSNSSGAFTYSSSNPSVATITGNLVNVLSSGSSNITATQDASGNYGPGSITSTLLVSNTCFPAGTPITVDQGIIAIEKINLDIHTINGKKIVDVIKSVSTHNSLVCFEKHALGYNIPSQRTLMTKNHGVFFGGKMRNAVEFIGKYDNVHKVKYSGEPLYNVLLEKHELMSVNNMICETLNPESPLVKINNILKSYNSEEKEILIKYCNKEFMNVIKNK